MVNQMQVIKANQNEWLDKVLGIAKNHGIYLPYVNVLEKEKRVRAYYTHISQDFLYFVTSENVYFYRKGSHLYPLRPDEGSESILDVDTGYKSPKQVIKLIMAIFHYIQYRSCDLSYTIESAIKKEEAKIKRINKEHKRGK